MYESSSSIGSGSGWRRRWETNAGVVEDDGSGGGGGAMLDDEEEAIVRR